MNIKIEWTDTMDRETIEEMMQKLMQLIEDFNDAPSIDNAKSIDKQTSVLRFCIGEDNFMPLHYFRAAHEDVVRYIDNMNKQKKETNNEQTHKDKENLPD